MIFFPFFVYLCSRKDKGVPGKGLRLYLEPDAVRTAVGIGFYFLSIPPFAVLLCTCLFQ